VLFQKADVRSEVYWCACKHAHSGMVKFNLKKNELDILSTMLSHDGECTTEMISPFNLQSVILNLS